jgi:diphosphomevalonate decarboxylase
MKVSAVAPANIAFIKYWGQKDKKLFLPYNGSISMNLDNCLTTTTLELSNAAEDEIMIAFNNDDYKTVKASDSKKAALLFAHIERIRDLAGAKGKVRIKSKNNFPADCGIASSASGFAALTLALAKAFNLKGALESKKELSSLVRLGGSVSAMRSVDDGYSEVVIQEDDCFSQQIFDENHWDLVNIVAITDKDCKKVSSTDGHLLAETSPHFQQRLKDLPGRVDLCKKSITEKDFSTFGELVEAECLSMHQVMQTSLPPVNYWNQGTIKLMEAIKQWRQEGLETYFTIDAGPNVHIICQEKDSKELDERLNKMEEVLFTITNHSAKGAALSENHLF